MMSFPKKVLALDIFFALPDDFDGDLIEALELFIEYKKNHKTNKLSEDDELEALESIGIHESVIDVNILWDSFADKYANNGDRLLGRFVLSEWDDVTLEWVNNT